MTDDVKTIERIAGTLPGDHAGETIVPGHEFFALARAKLTLDVPAALDDPSLPA